MSNERSKDLSQLVSASISDDTSQSPEVVRPTGNPKDDMIYKEPAPNGIPPSFLTVKPGTEQENRYRFYDRIQLARYRTSNGPQPPGVLFIKDRTISSKHCEIGLGPDGSFYIRDVSRNGTRLDDRRLEPNIEQKINTGQKIRVGLQPERRRVGAGVLRDAPGRGAPQVLLFPRARRRRRGGHRRGRPRLLPAVRARALLDAAHRARSVFARAGKRRALRDASRTRASGGGLRV